MTSRLFFLFLVAALGLSAPAADQPGPVPVDVYTVTPARDIPVSLEYPARLESVAVATVTARITGVLLKQYFREGEYVERGALLYQIEPDLYDAAFKEREADLALQEALYAKAKRDWERAKALFEEKTLSRQEYDAALSAFETAGAAVHAAGARLASAKVEQAYTQVRAPISGIAGVRTVDVGNVVSPGDPLVTITRTDPLFAAFSLPGSDAVKLKKADQEGRWEVPDTQGLPVRFTGENGTLQGSLDYLDPAIDPRTGTLRARATLDNKAGHLIPGVFGRVRLEGVTYRSALVVPQKAVLQNELGAYLLVISDGKASSRRIRLEGSEGNGFILKSGVAPGEQVITNNFFKVKDGTPVRVDKSVTLEEAR